MNKVNQSAPANQCHVEKSYEELHISIIYPLAELVYSNQGCWLEKHLEQVTVKIYVSYISI